MEKDAYPANVHFIDEYPDLEKRVWLRRLAQQRLAKTAVHETTVIYLPDPPDQPT